MRREGIFSCSSKQILNTHSDFYHLTRSWKNTSFKVRQGQMKSDCRWSSRSLTWHPKTARINMQGKLFSFFKNTLLDLYSEKKPNKQTLMESQSESLFVGYLRGIRVFKKQYDGSEQLRVNTRGGKAAEFPSCSYLYQPQRLHLLIFSTATSQNSVELHHCNLKIICHQINPLSPLTLWLLSRSSREMLEIQVPACVSPNFLGAVLNRKRFLWHSDFSFLLQLQLPMPHKTLLLQSYQQLLSRGIPSGTWQEGWLAKEGLMQGSALCSIPPRHAKSLHPEEQDYFPSLWLLTSLHPPAPSITALQTGWTI